MGQVHWSVTGWTSHLCLWVPARPVPQGVLPSGPRCVQELRLSLALSSVLHCPLLGFSVTSPALARGLGLSLVPYPHFCRLGLVPRSVAQFAPCSRWCPLSRCSSLRLRVLGVLGSLHCAPLTVGPLPGPPALLCLLSAGCLLGLETSPSGGASASS